MDNETDNPVDVTNPVEIPDMPSQQAPHSTGQDETLQDILTQSSRDLIRTFAASISQQAAEETSKSEEFKREFKKRLIRTIIMTYVWSTARLTREAETAEARLGKGVQELLAAERDEGRSSPHTRTMMERLRARLAELMAAVSRALEMFG